MSTFQICLALTAILFSWGIMAKVSAVFFPGLKLILGKVSTVLLGFSPVLFLFGLSLNISDLFGSLVCFSLLLSLYVFFYALVVSCYKSYRKLNEESEGNETMKAFLSLCLARDKSEWLRKFMVRLKKIQSKPSEVQEDSADWWKKDNRWRGRFN